MFDVQTIGLLTVFSTAALALSLFMLFTIRHKEKSVLPMAFANLLFSLSFFFLLMQSTFPPILSVIAANILFLYSLICYGCSFSYLLGFRYPFTLSFLVLVLTTVSLICFTYFWPITIIRIHNMNVAIAFLICINLFLSLKRMKIVPKPIFIFWIVTQGLYISILVFRSAVTFLHSTYHSIWESKNEIVAIILSLYFVILFSNLGYILILAFRYFKKTEKLLRKVQVLNQKLIRDVKDKTEDLDEAHKQLMISEKMASLGIFTAGIAHELNNPINYIALGLPSVERDNKILQNYCLELEELIETTGDRQAIEILNQLRLENRISEILEDLPLVVHGINKGVEKIVSIVESLKSFAKPEKEVKQPVNIAECVESSLLILNHFLNDEIKIVKRFKPVPVLLGSPGKIGQVFINILHNAIQAIYEKSEKANETIEIVIEPGKQQEKQDITIKIRDTGIGIPDEHLNHIFDPFFTHKEEGQGTGLGLSIVHKIVDDHKGFISVNRPLEGGSEFIISLPVAQTY